MQSNKNTIGVVVPTLNEERVIVDNLQSLLADPFLTKIIVVDGGSVDKTSQLVGELALDNPTRLTFVTSPPGRGKQMNTGASQLDTCWLLFHHADSKLPPSAGEVIAELSEDIQWGGFTHQFTPNNWKLKIVSALHNYRCRRTRVIYGDQSMFIRRQMFRRVGAFDEFGIEDLQYSDRALRYCPSELLPQEVRTASRKFTQIGEFRALLQTLQIIYRYEKNRKIGNETFFKNYR